jgi:hypothetical protein
MSNVDDSKKGPSIIQFHVPEGLYNEIQSMINTAVYRDWQQFLETSVRNQLTLESTRSAKDATLLGDQIVQTRFPTYRELGRMWDRTRLHFFSPLEIRSLRSPHMPFCNRILPVKVAARVLCNLLEDQDTLTTEAFGETLSIIVVDLGMYLLALDRSMNRALRLEALSTGFPVRKRDKQASKRRFMNHFVGSLDSAGRASGMILNLGFATIDSSDRIGVTEIGEEFARIENPILDSRTVDKNLESDLSDAEIGMYLRIADQRLPQEVHAMNVIKEILKNGSKSYKDIREEFDKAIGSNVPDARSLVSPLLSRMRELLLVRVRSEGLKTYYDLR